MFVEQPLALPGSANNTVYWIPKIKFGNVIKRPSHPVHTWYLLNLQHFANPQHYITVTWGCLIPMTEHILSYTLRFILPCKSDCQPIFLKKQGIFSVYTQLWLLGPLIKNIPDSSHQYGSNVTFGESLAFQMREEYVFEEIFFLKIGPQRG